MFSLVRTNELRGTISEGRFVPEVSLPRPAPGPDTYRNCGSFYLFRPEGSFLIEQPFGRTIAPYVMEHPEFEVDIDYEADMQLAECLLMSNRERFGHFEI
jgi:CMP-N-acetylneuraminic acid synthetase